MLYTKSLHQPGSACVGYQWQCDSCSQSGFPGPAGLGVLLKLYGQIGCKTLRGLARLELCVFLPAVALPGHIHKTCINDRTLLGAAALQDQRLIEALEQGFMEFMPAQLLSKQPDGPGIRNFVFQAAP